MESEWKTTSTNGAAVKLAAENEDGINKFGSSLALDFTIPAGGRVTLYTEAKGFDLSQADRFGLLFRRAELEGFPGKIEILLQDLQGNRFLQDIKSRRLSLNPRWDEVTFPKEFFGKVDFDEIDRFELILTNPTEQSVSGKVVVDEIAFFGKEDLVFKSNLDNLRSFPKEAVAEKRRTDLLAVAENKEFLRQVVSDTWRYFENLVDVETGLPVDHIRVGRSTGIGSYISPTNVAFYWIACVGAADLSLITREEAIEKIRKSFEKLERMKRWEKGIFFNFYNTHHLGATHRFVSSVDNGWLAAGFAIVRQAYPEEFKARADEFLKGMNFAEFYDPSNGHLRLGYDVDNETESPYHYGLLVTEARIASYVGIGKGDLPKEHWARIYRTLPRGWEWQKQIPEGKETSLFGTSVFEGHYTYRGRQFVPSWGGSLFEFLAPALVIDEQNLAPNGLGKNNKLVTDFHIEYAILDQKYSLWGIAPCAIQNGKLWSYKEYGVPDLGAKGYLENGVFAPYATFLALVTRPEKAIQNLRKTLSLYPESYGEYGFYDSVDVKNNRVNHQYLLIDQAMSFIAAVNYLADGAIQKRFHADPIGKAGEVVLKENFFE